MKAAIYARISRRDNNKTSIPNQLDDCRAFAATAGWEVIATHVEPGESGEDLDRPELAAVRATAHTHACDIVVISALDRLTRNIDDLFFLRREFSILGVPIHAVQDDVELTTADEEELLKVLFTGYFGHRELVKVKERLRRGRERSIRDGHHPGGPVPFGYRRSDDNRLIEDEEDAHAVRMIFGWCAQGDSTHKIADRLDQFGILPSQGRSGRQSRRRSNGTQSPATRWASVSVRYILRNETYLGTWTYNAASGPIYVPVPALIDPVTWQAAQDALTANRWRGCKPTYQYLLRGLIKCARCNSSYCGRHPSRPGAPHYYACLGRTDYKKRKMEKCASVGINGVELETAIWADVEQFIRQPHRVITELADHVIDDGVEGWIADAERALVDRAAEMERYLTQYGRGVIPEEMLDRNVRQVRTAIQHLETYHASLVKQQRRTDLRETEMANVIETLTKLQTRLDAGLDWETKRAITKSLVGQIIIETKGDEKPHPIVHVTYSFEPQPDAPIPAELSPLFGVVLDRMTNRIDQYYSIFRVFSLR